METEIDWNALEAAARAAALSSYSPYSRFPVGAAVLTPDGSIFAGCNVENASLGLTCCAERNAVFQAVAAGHRQIVAVALHTPTPEPTTPCGACRQVLQEFGPGCALRSTCDGKGVAEATLDTLLPSPFASLITGPNPKE